MHCMAVRGDSRQEKRAASPRNPVCPGSPLPQRVGRYHHYCILAFQMQFYRNLEGWPQGIFLSSASKNKNTTVLTTAVFITLKEVLRPPRRSPIHHDLRSEECFFKNIPRCVGHFHASTQLLYIKSPSDSKCSCVVRSHCYATITVCPTENVFKHDSHY